MVAFIRIRRTGKEPGLQKTKRKAPSFSYIKFEIPVELSGESRYLFESEEIGSDVSLGVFSI